MYAKVTDKKEISGKQQAIQHVPGWSCEDGPGDLEQNGSSSRCSFTSALRTNRRRLRTNREGESLNGQPNIKCLVKRSSSRNCETHYCLHTQCYASPGCFASVYSRAPAHISEHKKQSSEEEGHVPVWGHGDGHGLVLCRRPPLGHLPAMCLAVLLRTRVVGCRGEGEGEMVTHEKKRATMPAEFPHTSFCSKEIAQGNLRNIGDN